MIPTVANAISELTAQFPSSVCSAREDGQGGAHIIVEGVDIGDKFRNSKTWFGFHLTAQFPYADIYPVFMASDVALADGRPFAPPVTSGHSYEGRNAIQISRRCNGLSGKQKATTKLRKILDFLKEY
jgi:hypothetical protein